MVSVMAVAVICVCTATGVSTVLTLIDSLGLLEKRSAAAGAQI